MYIYTCVYVYIHIYISYKDNNKITVFHYWASIPQQCHAEVSSRTNHLFWTLPGWLLVSLHSPEQKGSPAEHQPAVKRESNKAVAD